MCLIHETEKMAGGRIGVIGAICWIVYVGRIQLWVDNYHIYVYDGFIVDVARGTYTRVGVLI